MTTLGLEPMEKSPDNFEFALAVKCRLRVRKITEPDGRRIFKLAKKYGPTSPGVEGVANLYLAESEHATLSRLPGAASSKRRYRLAGGALDLYEHPRAGLMVFEVEFADEAAAQAYSPPHFVAREITGDPAFSGAALAMRHAE